MPIIPIRNKYFNCYDAVVATYANLVNRDYELFLADAWGFEYDGLKQSVRLGDKISRGNSKGLYYLALYHGIILEEKNIPNYRQLLAVLKSNKHSSGLSAITIDSFFCPWDKCYRQFHNKSHIVIIIDISTDLALCLDPFYSEDLLELPLTELKNGYTGTLITFTKLDKIEYPDCKSIIKNSTEKQTQTNAFNKMVLFADDMKVQLKYEIEGCGYKNFWHSPVMFQLGRIELSRARYALSLNYMANKYNFLVLMDYAEQFFTSMKKWKMVRSILAMGQMKNDYKILNDVALAIKNIAEYEKRICYNLEKFQGSD